MSGSHIRKSEALCFSHVWLLWLLSTVLKCCCHGPSTEKGNRLFLPLCVLRPTCGSKPSIRERCREGLPPRPRPGVGRTKGLTACLASGTLLISRLWDMQSLAEFCQLRETWLAEDVIWMWMMCLYGRQALQSVGNLGLQLGHGKEQWMAPLHPIILRSVASVKDFLDKLIDIDHDIGKAYNTTKLVLERQVQRSCCPACQLLAAPSWYQN